ncbi:SDR family NAD(P)-dependent oxidoreductase [Nocardia sp. CC201C]|uniref:SDR family NAD(P)-dependent oxidoreductase n=1 Tax=Nocardia sp. CC201C TaxID=3044575 RepID=UPI0024A8A446|nr:SDR family NAD(P)-dependent oxidoreductase [Nocardia sp. CC201C]
MNQRLAGRRALVTGAGAGIGRATVLRLLREGASVFAVGRSIDGLKGTVELAGQQGDDDRISLAVLDVSVEADVERVVPEAAAVLGGLDILVNSAGILRGSHTHETGMDLWNEVIGVNLTGTFLVSRASIPALLESRGVVINVGSTASDFAHPYMAAYAASKGGLKAFTKTLALEYETRGLRAVCIASGGIRTAMTENPSYPADADWNLLTRLKPLVGGGLGHPDMVAGVIAMVASEDGAFITGTEIRIDGGAHM